MPTLLASRSLSWFGFKRGRSAAGDASEKGSRCPEFTLLALRGQTVAQASSATSPLVKGLEAHRSYWSKDEDRRFKSTGFLSIPLTGIASMAYDKGFRFDIDAEYLPMWLVAGE